MKINGEKIQVSPGGTFSVSVSLKEGINELTVTAENRFGKISTKTITVVVETKGETTADNTKNHETIALWLRVPDKSVFLEVQVDGKLVFGGLMLAGSSKKFEAREKIKIVSEDARATLVKIGDREFPLGDEKGRIEREFTPSAQ